MDGFWSIGEKEAYQSGVDYGNGSRPIRVVAKYEQGGSVAFVVVKIPGGHHWAGIGMDQISYAGAYHVLQILEQTDDKRFYRCKDLMYFPLRN